MDRGDQLLIPIVVVLSDFDRPFVLVKLRRVVHDVKQALFVQLLVVVHKKRHFRSLYHFEGNVFVLHHLLEGSDDMIDLVFEFLFGRLLLFEIIDSALDLRATQLRMYPVLEDLARAPDYLHPVLVLDWINLHLVI